MIELLLIAVVAVVSFLVHRHYKHHPDYDLAQVLDSTFAQLQFPLRDGRQMPGREVTVLQKPGLYSMPLSVMTYETAYDTDGFWYCAGPDGHFWMAVSHHERQWFLWKVRWMVRPLTAERLRSALQDNPEALQRALGDVQIDRLMA